MRKLWFFLLMLCVVCSSNLSAASLVAVDSCRTSLNNGTTSDADTVKADSNKLSVRGDAKAAKSWIKFDISSLDVGSLTECKLQISLYKAKSSTCLLSAVNDDYTTNISWSNADLTWNTGPGNYTSADGVNADITSVSQGDLQDNLDPSQTTLIGTVDYTNGAAGDSYLIDVLPILQADTDGIVQFVLHGSGGSTDFATHTADSGEETYPMLVYETIPGGDCPDYGTTYVNYASQSCRTELFDGTNARVDDVRADNNKLSVRGDSKASKSWIKFDISDLGIDTSLVKSATIRVTLYAPKDNTCLLSAINDDYLDNIDWTDGTLTWNNAPGNITSTDGVNPEDTSYSTDDLQDNLDPGKTTLIGTVDYSAGSGGVAGDQYFLDVTSIVKSDTDGIIQFALHGAGGYTTFATHDMSTVPVTDGEAVDYYPQLTILEGPAGADNPYPCQDDIVSSDLVGLSWSNPDPNTVSGAITPTVYLGTTDNKAEMDSVTLAPNAQGVLLNTANFPNFGNLQNLTDYYWTVDCYDNSPGEEHTKGGDTWHFRVNNNDAPIVDAGPDITVWLGMSGTAGQEAVDVDATVTDDGLPNPPAAFTMKWTQVDNGAAHVGIDPNDVEDISLTFSERGDYEFLLTASDGAVEGSDTVRIVVGDTPCDASHMETGEDFAAGDSNDDCLVDLQDLVMLIINNWLDCTDALTNCED